IRQFSLWDMLPEEMEGFFPEFRPFVHLCAFPDCTHTHEERCAVKRAVYRRQVSASRYTRYLRLISGEAVSCRWSTGSASCYALHLAERVDYTLTPYNPSRRRAAGSVSFRWLSLAAKEPTWPASAFPRSILQSLPKLQTASPNSSVRPRKCSTPGSW